MSILKLIKLADVFTAANLVCGLLAMIFSINSLFFVASIFLFSSVFFDFLDGRIAYLLKEQNNFGKELDSLSDIVSFGVAPAIFFYCLSSRSTVVVLSIVFFVVCGMLRLARYNITKTKDFVGVPITVNGVLFPVLYLLAVQVPIILTAIPFVCLVMGFLMVSNITVRRVF
ncbi:MAG: CDP-diacylglycerol--serine O-phosphatidyltransferase [Candidatus Woesearchaeota archaeon]